MHNKSFQRTPNTSRLVVHAYGIIAQSPLNRAVKRQLSPVTICGIR
jgi:hypothetical protein